MITESSKHSGKVLVVDDEPQNLQLVGENLRRAGIPFLFAINGDEALNVVREDPPALILLDVMMPGIDGFEVCKQLKAEHSTAHIPVIFLTAASSTGDLVSGFAAGAVDYIRKPFIREELLARVKTHLQLQDSYAQLDQQAQQRAELLTRLAHDIKNPSSGITGLVQLIRGDMAEGNESKEELCSILDIIESCAQGMSELVNGILDDAANKHDERSHKVDTAIKVVDVLEHLIKLNAVHAQARNIHLELDAQRSPSVSIGRRILNEMFDNLLSNAVKYSKADTCIHIRITEAETIRSGFRISVEDTAQALALESIESLFKRFVRGQPENKSPQSSHGIGLSVVKRLVDFHNGIVGAQARPDGTGNTFFVELPLDSKIDSAEKD